MSSVVKRVKSLFMGGAPEPAPSSGGGGDSVNKAAEQAALDAAKAREQQQLQLARQRQESQVAATETQEGQARARRIPPGKRLLFALTGEQGLPSKLGG